MARTILARNLFALRGGAQTPLSPVDCPLRQPVCDYGSLAYLSTLFNKEAIEHLYGLSSQECAPIVFEKFSSLLSMFFLLAWQVVLGVSPDCWYLPSMPSVKAPGCTKRPKHLRRVALARPVSCQPKPCMFS